MTSLPEKRVDERVENTNEHRFAAGLELERRLYEAAISGVDQTFAKEGLVAAFLTSGAIVAFAAGLGAFAQIAPSVGQRATWAVTSALAFSLILLVISIIRFASVLRGWTVQDLSDAEKFLNEDPVPTSRDEVTLKLMAEYRQARINHENLIKSRLKNLFGAMWWLGSATVVSFVAILGAFLSVSIHKEPIRPKNDLSKVDIKADLSGSKSERLNSPNAVSNPAAPTYNKSMATTSGTQKPPPVVLPKPGSGTTMIKGGGGNGSR